MSEEICFYTKNKPASNDVDYVGYYGSDPKTKAYRGIIGLSVANFDVVEEHVYVPRSTYAKYIHISAIFIKAITFISLVYLINMNWFWEIVLAFLGAIATGLLFNLLFKTIPRSLYLFNLSSIIDFAVFIFPPLLSYLFFPDVLGWFVGVSFIMLFFINSFTWRLKKYHLFPYPDKLYSMYEVGFKHGFHPQMDNYLGFIVKPLRWFY